MGTLGPSLLSASLRQVQVAAPVPSKPAPPPAERPDFTGGPAEEGAEKAVD